MAIGYVWWHFGGKSTVSKGEKTDKTDKTLALQGFY